MRKSLVALAVASAALASPARGQDWKGTGRMQGKVLDEHGQPVAEAIIRLELPSRGGGTTLKTDKKGLWTIGGIAAGSWHVDIEAAGFAPKRLTVPLPTESARLAPVEVRLQKAGPKGPSPELLAALRRGDDAYQAGRWAEARAEYEGLVPRFQERPEIVLTLHQQIARCYSQEGDVVRELEHLQAVIDADPKNAALLCLMAQEAIKGGFVDRGTELLKGVEDGSVKDPDVLFNIAILYLNQQRPEDAVAWLTRAVNVDPAYVDGYFQRALAYLQLRRLAESKADFRKVLELARTGPKAETARRALEQIQ